MDKKVRGLFIQEQLEKKVSQALESGNKKPIKT
jgi:ribosomal protein S19